MAVVGASMHDFVTRINLLFRVAIAPFYKEFVFCMKLGDSHNFVLLVTGKW